LHKILDKDDSVPKLNYEVVDRKSLSGYFISFEGGEGCGKSTQVKKLKSYLEKKGYSVVDSREPGGLELGEELRNLALNAEYDKSVLEQVYLFEASRSEYVEKLVIPALEKGEVFISDRFYDSTTVYQGFAGGADMDLIKILNNAVSRNLKPDITFLLDIPAKIGLKRVAAGKQEFENGDFFEKKKIEFHQSIRKAYLTLASNNTNRFYVIDGTKSINNCARRIQERIKTIK
jgi:dTMP kinase